MNLAVLCGRLVREPDLKESQGGMKVCRYTIAVDRRAKKGEDAVTDFLSCVAFDKGAEFAGKYFRKGMRVLVRGRIQTGSYTKKDGSKAYTTDIMVDEQEFADGKAEASGTKAPAKKPQKEPDYQQESFMDIPDGVDDSGLPFN